MRLAYSSSLIPYPDFVFIDGLPVRDFPCEQPQSFGAGRLPLGFHCRRIHYRQSRAGPLMCAYDTVYPEYGFAGHKGYGSAKHMDALREHGPCPIHRRSFAPVAASER